MKSRKLHLPNVVVMYVYICVRRVLIYWVSSPLFLVNHAQPVQVHPPFLNCRVPPKRVKCQTHTGFSGQNEQTEQTLQFPLDKEFKLKQIVGFKSLTGSHHLWYVYISIQRWNKVSESSNGMPSQSFLICRFSSDKRIF